MIEPSEEQRQTAFDLLQHGSLNCQPSGDVDRLADLLAEREHALRESLSRLIEAIDLQAKATALPRALLNVARGVLKEHPFALDRIADLEKVVREQQAERDSLREQVATLAALLRTQAPHVNIAEVRLADECRVDALMGRERVLQEREAQHLADIATLRRLVEDRVDISYSEAEDALAATAHYEVKS